MPTALAETPSSLALVPPTAAERTRWPRRIGFVLTEWSASFGDLGTFLPLAMAVALTGTLDFGCILVCAGLMNLLSGWSFRQPIPAQPMKALAAVAITQPLAGGEIAAAGLMVAICLLLLAVTGATDRAARLVPKPVVRGIQLGIGLKLITKGLEWLFGLKWHGLNVGLVGGLPFTGLDSLCIAGVAAVLLCAPRLRRLPLLLPIFLAGFVLAGFVKPQIWNGWAVALPDFSPRWPSLHDFGRGILQAGLPQLPLTLLNSVVAICALSADYFPRAGIGPRKMALQIGLVNLLVVPFGGLPMCHGAGGLAAQYRFGARSGLSTIALGAMMIAAGLLVGSSMIHVLTAYPVSILAVMLILAGWTLGRVARDSLAGPDLLVLLATLLPILLINTAVGFVVGLTVAIAIRKLGSRRVAP